ncbi:MAG: VOC family protein [Sphingopyxis sp.]
MSVVPDLAAAADAARRIGFTVTDRGVHSGRGTSNHLIVLPDCYWELLAVDEPTPFNGRVREALSHPGLFGCALATRDIARDRERTLAAGIPTDAPVAFVRPVDIDGSVREAGFRTAQLRPHEPFDGYFFFCEHRTPELVWRSEWMRHPNGALRIHGVDVAAGAPATAGALLGRLFGAPFTATGDEGRIELGAIRLGIERDDDNSSDRAPRFTTLRIAVADLDRAAAMIEAAGFRPERRGQTIVLRVEAFGDTMLAFEAAPKSLD